MARTPTTTDAFNAVAEASRRDLLDALGTGEATVGELVDRLGLSQPRCPSTWRVLRAVGLVLVRADGRHRWYRVNGPALKPIHDWVRTFERAWNTRLDRLDDLLAELKHRRNTMTSTTATATAPPSSPCRPTPRSSSPASSSAGRAVFKALHHARARQALVGLRDLEWLVCEIDLRVGGTWRYVIQEGGSRSPSTACTARSTRPTASSPPRCTRAPRRPTTALNTVTLDEVDGVTTMTCTVVHKSPGAPRRNIAPAWRAACRSRSPPRGPRLALGLTPNALVTVLPRPASRTVTEACDTLGDETGRTSRRRRAGAAGWMFQRPRGRRRIDPAISEHGVDRLDITCHLGDVDDHSRRRRRRRPGARRPWRAPGTVTGTAVAGAPAASRRAGRTVHRRPTRSPRRCG